MQAVRRSARAVANFFLQRGWSEGIPIDHLKLQKLVYYAHAWHLGNGFGPLFDEPVEAWPHGPVVRDVYIEFKSFGRQPITRLAREVDFAACQVVEPVVPHGDNRTASLLESVWQAYRALSGVQLSNQTHQVDEPWVIVKKWYDLRDKPLIPSDLIEMSFRQKLERARAAGSAA